MSRLVLLRHGESEWNKLNLFTGWYDCDLTENGFAEAVAAGGMLAEAHIKPDVLHTSVQVRAIRTANITLDVLGRLWIPVRRSWRLNERHYGDLTGRNKAETTEKYGEEKVKIWRRSYDVPPPRSPPRTSSTRTTTCATSTSRLSWSPPRSAWPTSSTECSPIGTTRSCRTWPRATRCWWSRTATRCAPW